MLMTPELAAALESRWDQSQSKLYFALVFDPVALNLKPRYPIHLYTTNSTVYNSSQKK